MSMVHERIRIEVKDGETIKQISNLVLDDLEYDLVDQDGEVFTAAQGLEAIRRLKEAEPDKDFIALPA